MLKPALVKNTEFVIAIKTIERQNTNVENDVNSTEGNFSKRVFTQYACTNSVWVVVNYTITPTQAKNLNISLGDAIEVFRDDNLLGDAVAAKKLSAVSLHPKPLQLMPYQRAWQEAFLFMIPWLGLIISGYILLSISLLKLTVHTPKKLKFSFPSWFYFLSGFITLYPVVLTYMAKSNLIIWTSPLAFLLLACLNLLATKHRNNQVTQYNKAILSAINEFKN